MWYNTKSRVRSEDAMTAEIAMYYSAMLRVGLGDGFYQAFDKALEERLPAP